MPIKKGELFFTPRDLKIFKFLSYYGYADLESLYMLTNNFYPCSKKTFLGRMYKLKASGYLEINYYNMPGSDKENPFFKFIIVSGNTKTFIHLKMRPPEIKIFKSNFFHEFFIIRTLAKCMENGEEAYTERMDEYVFSNSDLRPDVYMPDKKIGFEIETSVKRNYSEYARKFAVLQKHLEDAKYKKEELKIKKLIYLAESSEEQISLMKKFQNTYSKTVDLDLNGVKFVLESTVKNHVAILNFDDFFKKNISDLE